LAGEDPHDESMERKEGCCQTKGECYDFGHKNQEELIPKYPAITTCGQQQLNVQFVALFFQTFGLKVLKKVHGIRGGNH